MHACYKNHHNHSPCSYVTKLTSMLQRVTEDLKVHTTTIIGENKQGINGKPIIERRRDSFCVFISETLWTALTNIKKCVIFPHLPTYS